MKNRITPRDYELISAYLDNQLSNKERQHLEARLQAIPELRKELQELSKTRLMLRSVPKLRAPHNYFINPAIARVPAGIPRSARLAPAMGIVSALATIMLVLVIFGQTLLTPAGPVALSPASQVPAAPMSVQQEQQRNVEPSPTPTESIAGTIMEAPKFIAPETPTSIPSELMAGSAPAVETGVPTPTTIYLNASLPTATPEYQTPIAGGLGAAASQISCEDYFKNNGAYPPPSYIPDCPKTTESARSMQLNQVGTATSTIFTTLTASPTITTTLTPTPSETPTPTPTLTPSPSPTPTATEFPAPTATPNAALMAAPSEDSGISENPPPEMQTGLASPATETAVPVEQPQPSPGDNLLRYFILTAEISLATIAIGSGITALILRLRAGR